MKNIKVEIGVIDKHNGSYAPFFTVDKSIFRMEAVSKNQAQIIVKRLIKSIEKLTQSKCTELKNEL